MYLLKSFDWKEFLIGSEEWRFLPEVGIRTVIMFLVIVISLSILGKRGVKQLSVFELVVIIGLGSAAGDPMFYNDVGLLPAFIVFAIVVSLYTIVTRLVGKNKKIEHMVEGKPVYLIEEGRFAIDNFSKEPLGLEEFFAELRVRGVSQLGQVEIAIEETNGQLSVFFYEDKNVKYGLPIMPGSLDNQVMTIKVEGYYACIFCGEALLLKPSAKHNCPECKKDKWVKASNRKRVT